MDRATQHLIGEVIIDLLGDEADTRAYDGPETMPQPERGGRRLCRIAIHPRPRSWDGRRKAGNMSRVTSEHLSPVGWVPREVSIVHLTGSVFDALARGDLATANAASPVPLTDYFAGPDWRTVWAMRSEQVRQDPPTAAWVTGVIWDGQQHLAVGRAGYHGPPDPAGMVEIGYAVDPAHRRRGYARAALELLLHRAALEPAVRTVRVTIRPDNTASAALVSDYGFVAVGQQWDDEDGLEIIYEAEAGTGS